MRTLITIGILLLVIVVGGLALIYSFRDPLLKASIEQIGSDASGTALTIGGLETDLVEGEIVISNLEIDNPSGFSPNTAITIPTIRMQMDLGNSPAGTIVFQDIRVGPPDILFEIAGGTSNIEKLRQNIEDYGLSQRGSTSSGNSFIVETLRIDEGTITVRIADTEPDTLSLPAFSMEDLGNETSGPLSGPMLTAKVLNEIARRVVDQIAKSPYQQRFNALMGATPF